MSESDDIRLKSLECNIVITESGSKIHESDSKFNESTSNIVESNFSANEDSNTELKSDKQQVLL